MARDVRKVDPTFALRLEPAFIVRRGVILVTLAPCDLHAIILRTRVFLLLPPHRTDPSEDVIRALNKMLDEPAQRQPATPGAHRKWAAGTEGATPGTGPCDGSRAPAGAREACEGKEDSSDALRLPFEFVALEALLATACCTLHARTISLERRVDTAVEAIRLAIEDSSPSLKASDQLREMKNALDDSLEHAQAVERALSRLLETDQDMAGMQLTGAFLAASCLRPAHSAGGSNASPRSSLFSRAPAQPDATATSQRPSEPHAPLHAPLHAPPHAHAPPPRAPAAQLAHESLEILLETYLQEMEQTIDALELSVDDVVATEKLVSFRLDAARNRLLKVEVAATAIGTAMGVGAVTTGMLGMNLQTPLFTEYPDGASFTTAVVGICLFCATITFTICCFLYCPARRLRRLGKRCCSCFITLNRGETLPKLPSADSTQRRLLSAADSQPFSTSVMDMTPLLAPMISRPESRGRRLENGPAEDDDAELDDPHRDLEANGSGAKFDSRQAVTIPINR